MIPPKCICGEIPKVLLPEYPKGGYLRVFCQCGIKPQDLPVEDLTLEALEDAMHRYEESLAAIRQVIREMSE